MILKRQGICIRTTMLAHCTNKSPSRGVAVPFPTPNIDRRRRRHRYRLKGIHSRSDTNRIGAEGLSFYYPRLLHCLNQMLAVVLLSQHRISSSKTVRPRAPCNARCIEHGVSTWSTVCSEAPHSQFGEGADPICAWTNGIAQHQPAGG